MPFLLFSVVLFRVVRTREHFAGKTVRAVARLRRFPYLLGEVSTSVQHLSINRQMGWLLGFTDAGGCWAGMIWWGPCCRLLEKLRPLRACMQAISGQGWSPVECGGRIAQKLRVGTHSKTGRGIVEAGAVGALVVRKFDGLLARRQRPDMHGESGFGRLQPLGRVVEVAGAIVWRSSGRVALGQEREPDVGQRTVLSWRAFFYLAVSVLGDGDRYMR